VCLPASRHPDPLANWQKGQRLCKGVEDAREILRTLTTVPRGRRSYVRVQERKLFLARAATKHAALHEYMGLNRTASQLLSPKGIAVDGALPLLFVLCTTRRTIFPEC
jgi:hypothetical protein